MSVKCPKCHSDNPETQRFCGECATPLLTSEAPKISVTKTLETPKEELTRGTTLAGRYEILEELGRGGMGNVYRVVDKKINEEVALKLLKPGIGADRKTLERFSNELKLARKIVHKNVGRMYHLGEERGTHFITMEYVPGQDLKGLIRQSGQLAVGTTINIAKQICEGLAEAHKLGVVHRDLKPSNIMIDKEGNARIMDFGIARSLEAKGITGAGVMIGTPEYMSPEQARGQVVDHRTDIWSLGVVLYEMLTGQLPFKGDNVQTIIYSILNNEPEPLAGLRSEVTLELERIVGKALAKSPDKRYRDMDEMLADIQSVKKELEAEEATAKVSLLRDLFRRRVPQIVGIYFIAAWGIIQFVKWLVNRYVLSPYLPDFSLVVLLSMIPTISILGYFHGRRGRDKWTKVEKISIPVNLLASVVLLFFMFYGKDLGAATKTITLKNEEGQMIERVIPKSEFRKKVAMFFFDNETGDSTLDWLQYGIPDMVGYDLSQDIYLEIESGYNFYEKIKERGFPQAVQVPLTLKKKIADDLHKGYFVTGSFAGQSGQFLIKISLHDTKTGKPIVKSAFSGKDIFNLVDDISKQLKHDLKIPAYHIEKTEDLPVAEILTNSIPALKAFYSGINKLEFDRDWEGSIKLIEQAVKEDPTFASAYYNLQALYVLSNQGEKRVQAFQPLMQHLYKLPERMQFIVKHDYYFAIKQDPDKAFAVLKMWTELYPEDIRGHTVLATLYLLRSKPDEAISVYKRILELDPEQYDVLRTIGSLYKQTGETEEALKHYQQYADKFPNDAKSFTAIGGLYKTLGDYEQAKSYYEKALLLEPDKISILLILADIESELGNFKQALEQYQDALKISKTPEDRVKVDNSLVSFHERRGQMSKSLEYMDLKFAEMEKFQPLSWILLERMDALDKYIKAGKNDVAFQTIKAIEEQIAPPFDKFMPFGYLAVYLELEDADNAEKAIEGVEAAIQAFRLEIVRGEILGAQGKIHEIRGEYEQAILSFQKQSELEPTAVTVNRDIGRCYRKLKDFKKAEEYVQKTLKIYPFEPRTNYEMALVYFDMGKKKQAMEHLKKALYVWAEADPEYKPAKKARDKLAEWESYTSKVK